MFDKEKQSQKAGDNSNQLMVNTMNVGLSYAEVRQIATDLFKDNHKKLSKIARDIANKRMDQITDEIIEKFASLKFENMSFVKEPGFQHCLYHAQVEYAKCGDEDLKEVLINLILKRSELSERSLIQIAVEEALVKASQLTTEQLNALSIVWLFSSTNNSAVNSLNMLNLYLKHYVFPVSHSLPLNSREHLHLLYTGTVIEEPSGYEPLAINLRSKYPAAFSLPLTELEIKELVEQEIFIDELFVENKDGNTMLLFDSSDKLHELINTHNLNISSVKLEKLKNLIKLKVYDEVKVKEEVLKVAPYMNDVFLLWDEYYFQRLRPTIVGIALAHAKLTGFITVGPLERWISPK